MASTPSASALSAVLRCQGNILARNPANKKRPAAASVYGLGMTYGANPSDRSYIRALLRCLFYGESVEIPGVLSVSTHFKSQSARRNSEANHHLVKNSDCRKIKVKSDYDSVAFKSERYGLLSKNNVVLRLDDKHLRKVMSEYHPRTFCICILCARSKSTWKQHETHSLFPLGLLSLLKNRLMYLTAAVSDIVRTRLGIDRTNQLHPDCDKLSGCATKDHKEAKSETGQGEASESEK